MLISFVIPCYHSTETVGLVVQSIEELAEANNYDTEIILVNDGPKAATFEKIKELYHKVKDGTSIEFLTLKDSAGHKSYVRTLTMLFIKAARDVVPAEESFQLKTEFALGAGYYFSVKGALTATKENAEKISARMKELVAAEHGRQGETVPLP